MKTLLFLALTVSAFAQKDYITPVIIKQETALVTTQTRPMRIEIFCEDPKAIRFVSHHVEEDEIGGKVRPELKWVASERSLPKDASDSVTVNGVKLTREEFVSFAAAFAQADRAADLAVKLSWKDNAKDEAGFELERAVAGKPFVPLAVLPADAQTFVDKAVTPATTYQYRVRAVNENGKSGYAVASATTRGIQ